jgi:hypothetical protein
MRAGFIRRQLRRRPRTLVLLGVFFTVVFGPCALGLLGVFGHRAGARDESVFFLVLFVGLAIVGPCLLVWGLRDWSRLDRHPDLVALSRYGPPDNVVSAIDAELADEEQVVRLGQVLKSFHLSHVLEGRELAGEVLLTPSWLVCLYSEDGRRLACLRLDSIVWVFREPTSFRAGPGLELPYQAVVLDRHGARLEIPGTAAGVSRLLAEVLSRVPWALDRFDEATERTWNEDRDQILADVDRRRDQIR